MGSSDNAPARVAAEAIGRRHGIENIDIYLNPEGDYLRLVQREPPLVDVSVSCCELTEGRYSVQICLNGDPLDIAYDDECDLLTLLDLIGRHFTRNDLATDPGPGPITSPGESP